MTRKSKFSRREFIVAAGAAGGAAALTLSGLVPTAAAQTVRVRPDISDPALDPRAIQALKDGVNAMKQLPQNDPRNWTAQANIHQNFCPHNNWFFLPWHRAYLHYFEQICREASGWPEFTLPYWDWTTNPKVPAPFWGDAGNPLFDNTRVIGPDDTADPEFVGPGTINDILATADFFSFASGVARRQRDPSTTGELESRPHNYIHGSFVEGNMATYMSPLDPIFWLHHANVDRVWTQWDQLHPSATTQDPRWLNFSLSRFFDPATRQPVSPRVNTLLSTYRLGYRYPSQPVQPPTQPRRFDNRLQSVQPNLRSQQAIRQQARTRNPATVNLTLPVLLRERVNSIASAATDAQQATKFRLAVGVERPDDLKTGVRVFINADNPGPDTPITHPGYVGTFTFFGPEGHHAGAGAGAAAGEGEAEAGSSFIFDATRAIERLSGARGLGAGATVRVSLVPVPTGKARRDEAAVMTTSVRLEAIPE